jgi:hypothetical protein
MPSKPVRLPYEVGRANHGSLAIRVSLPFGACIHEAPSLEPSSLEMNCSIATKLSPTTEMVGGLDTLVKPCSGLLRRPGARRISILGSAVIRIGGGLETLDKAVSVEGLGQVANRPGRKRPRANVLIGECGEKNERNTVTLIAQLVLQLDAAHTGHLDIRNYTREVVNAVRPQELFG